jgi:hypothetical protein
MRLIEPIPTNVCAIPIGLTVVTLVWPATDSLYGIRGGSSDAMCREQGNPE